MDDWARAGLGVATGGLSELPGLLGGSKTTTQVPLMTPEQKAAQDKLMGFANTGTFGDFTAGAAVPLSYGDFSTTAPENMGLSSLQQLLQNGIPSQYALGDNALKDILGAGAGGIAAQFDPFRAQTERQIGQSNADLKRGAGFAGDLYSTGTIKGLGDIQARGNETLTSQLAGLTNEALNRKLSAIPLAYQSAMDQQSSALQNIDASQKYGDLTRSLNDASIKARDAELLRRRQELQLPIDAAKTVSGEGAQFGVPSITTSPYQQLLGLAGQVGGTALGTYLGGPMGGAVGGKVGGSVGNIAAGGPAIPDYTANGTGMWRS